MRFVYRVQNNDGYGPYFGASCASWMDCNHHDSEQHPTPYADDGLFELWSQMEQHQRISYLFGFESKAQLQRWFTQAELIKLQGLGFQVIEIPIHDCEAIHLGTHQVIFKHALKK